MTAAAWGIQALTGLTEAAAIQGGIIPARFGAAIPGIDMIPALLTPLTSTLVHAGLLHLAMNMLILVYCGQPVERTLGSRAVVIIYLVGAYAAAAMHIVANIGAVLPVVGASGAVSAVIGAYAMLFSQSETRDIGPIPARWVRALWLGAGWIVVQWLFGVMTAGAGINVAIAAHIGGFIAGVALALPLLRRTLREETQD